MIAFLQSLPIGNAVRVVLAPPAGATKTRVLRKTADTFTGPADAGAAIVFEDAGSFFIDGDPNLQNGVPYFYRDYAWVSGAWVDSGFTASATPQDSGAPLGTDVLEYVRARLQVGLKAEVAAGRLHHETGAIPCLTAPPQFEGTKFPVVTVHLRSSSPAVRAIGEAIGEDIYDLDAGDWLTSEGWLQNVNVEVWGWVVENPDVRIALRKAIWKVLVGNLPVFNDAGIEQVELTQSDLEDFETYNARVFQTVCQFNCLAPSALGTTLPALTDVTLTQVIP